MSSQPFVDRVEAAMVGYFGVDARRIAHARQVAAYARQLLQELDADAELVLAAAYLHDIGIPEAERKYGSSAGPYQEQEGPSVARALLEQLGAPPELIADVCALVGSHHTPAAIDSQAFRILWDADALVNLAEQLPGKSTAAIERLLDTWLVTTPGRLLARRVYLPGVSAVEGARP